MRGVVGGRPAGARGGAGCRPGRGLRGSALRGQRAQRRVLEHLDRPGRPVVPGRARGAGVRRAVRHGPVQRLAADRDRHGLVVADRVRLGAGGPVPRDRGTGLRLGTPGTRGRLALGGHRAQRDADGREARRGRWGGTGRVSDRRREGTEPGPGAVAAPGLLRGLAGVRHDPEAARRRRVRRAVPSTLARRGGDGAGGLGLPAVAPAPARAVARLRRAGCSRRRRRGRRGRGHGDLPPNRRTRATRCAVAITVAPAEPAA